MSHTYDLGRIKNLSDIHEDWDIKQISRAIYPGFHCPLYACVMMSLQVEDMAILILGTQECGFYAKSLACRTNIRAKALYSLVVDQHDITFGCAQKLEDAVKKIDGQGKFTAVMVITSCVIELTGEDIRAVLDGLQTTVSKILLVQTEHFTRETPVAGLRETLSCLADVMEPQHKKENRINILGHGVDDFADTELAKFLKQARIDINVQIPTNCNIKKIISAPRAMLNIVLNFASLDLAHKMKENFGIDFVYFNQRLDPDDIRENYHKIETVMGICLGAEIDDLYDNTIRVLEKLKERVQGKTFVFSSPPMVAFKVSSLLCTAGMIPLWIQTIELEQSDQNSVQDILDKGFDPKVSRGKNSAPMAVVCEKLCPDYFFDIQAGESSGNERPRRISIFREIRGVGFEIPLNITKKILEES